MCSLKCRMLTVMMRDTGGDSFRLAGIGFGASTIVWAACHLDFACMPVDVGVVLRKPGVSQDNRLVAYAGNVEFGPASVTFVLNNQVNCFSDLSNLIWQSVVRIRF